MPQFATPFADSYRALLMAASRRPVNFAGRYRLTLWNARNGCFRGAAIDLETGPIAFLPLTLCGRARRPATYTVTFRLDSRLVAITDPKDGPGQPATRYFVLDGSTFSEVTKAEASPGPAPDASPNPGPPAKAPDAPAKTPDAPAKTPVAPPKTPEVALKTPDTSPKTPDVAPMAPDARAKPPDTRAKAPDAAVKADAPPKTPEAPSFKAPDAAPRTPDVPAKAPDAPPKTPKAPDAKPKADDQAMIQAPAEPSGTRENLIFNACGSTWGYFIDGTNQPYVSLLFEGLDKGPTLVLHVKDGATSNELSGDKDRGPWNLDLTVPPFGGEAISRIAYSGRLIYLSIAFIQTKGNRLTLTSFGFNDTGKPCPTPP